MLTTPTREGPAANPRGDGPTLILNPPSDAEFARWAKRLALQKGMSPADLQALLRYRYPAAVVRRRELSGETGEVWYVYRDGHWVSAVRRPRRPSR
ncbi:MAG TPA: hypothetical protein VF763_06380 [Candidatus Limnocylindrales bacterium]